MQFFKFKPNRLTLLIAVLSSIVFASPAATADVPFLPGEKLTFLLKWQFVPAGEAVMEVQPIKTIDGVSAYHFVLTAQSYPFFDMFYKVRDRIDGFADIDMTHSLLYKKKQREGDYRKQVVVSFDWKQHQARYSNFDKKKKTISVLPGSFDPLSVFYWSRFQDLRENTIISRPVSDGRRSVIGRAKVVRRETIKIKDKSYDTYLLEPELKHVRGVFRKSKNAKLEIWVTADERRLPVRIKSKVAVGSFIGELVSIRK